MGIAELGVGGRLGGGLRKGRRRGTLELEDVAVVLWRREVPFCSGSRWAEEVVASCSGIFCGKKQQGKKPRVLRQWIVLVELVGPNLFGPMVTSQAQVHLNRFMKRSIDTAQLKIL